MADEHHGTILRGDDADGRADVFGQRDRGILDDADLVPVLPQEAVDRLPARAIHEAAVDENDARASRLCSRHEVSFQGFWWFWPAPGWIRGTRCRATESAHLLRRDAGS